MNRTATTINTISVLSSLVLVSVVVVVRDLWSGAP